MLEARQSQLDRGVDGQAEDPQCKPYNQCGQTALAVQAFIEHP